MQCSTCLIDINYKSALLSNNEFQNSLAVSLVAVTCESVYILHVVAHFVVFNLECLLV